MALTGRFMFRRSFWGRILLLVEEEVRTIWPMSRHAPFRKRWRPATLMDLAAPELRALIDLRYKPQFMAQYEYLAPDMQPARADARSAPEGTNSLSAVEGRPNLETLKGADKTVEVERLRTIGRDRPQRSA
jgi:hypothetical protein